MFRFFQTFVLNYKLIYKLMNKSILNGVLLLSTTVLIGGCGEEPDFDEPLTEPMVEPVTYPVPKTLTELRSKISDFAWNFEMAAEEYPTTFTILGAQRFDEANSLLKWAAAVGAESPKCDKVDVSDVSEKSDRRNLLFFVDCVNWERIWVSEKNAKDARLKWEKNEVE